VNYEINFRILRELLYDFDIQTLRESENFSSFENSLKKNEKLKKNDMIKTGILLISVKKNYFANFSIFFNYLNLNFLNDFNEILDCIFKDSSVEYEDYEIIDTILSSCIGYELSNTLNKYISYKLSNYNTTRILELLEEIEIDKNIFEGNLHLPILKHSVNLNQDKNIKFLLLSLYLKSILHLNKVSFYDTTRVNEIIKEIDPTDLIKEVRQLLDLDINLFYSLYETLLEFYKIAKYTEINEYLYSKLSNYLDKDFSSISLGYIKDEIFINKIANILITLISESDSKKNLHVILFKLTDKIISKEFFLLTEISGWGDFTKNVENFLLYKFKNLLIKNRNYIIISDIIEIFTNNTREIYAFENTYIIRTLELITLDLFYNIEDNQIAYEYTIKLFNNLEDNEYYGYYSFLTYIINIYSNINDREILIKIYYKYIEEIPNINDWKWKLSIYLLFLTILKNLDEKKYYEDFEKLLYIDYIPNSFNTYLNYYYLEILISSKDKNSKIYPIIHTILRNIDSNDCSFDLEESKKIIKSLV
jgi:hypothetical protein